MDTFRRFLVRTILFTLVSGNYLLLYIAALFARSCGLIFTLARYAIEKHSFLGLDYNCFTFIAARKEPTYPTHTFLTGYQNAAVQSSPSTHRYKHHDKADPSVTQLILRTLPTHVSKILLSVHAGARDFSHSSSKLSRPD